MQREKAQAAGDQDVTDSLWEMGSDGSTASLPSAALQGECCNFKKE